MKPPPLSQTGRGAGRFNLEFEARERRALELSLVDRQAHLEELVGDTTRSGPARRRAEVETQMVVEILRRLRALAAP